MNTTIIANPYQRSVLNVLSIGDDLHVSFENDPQKAISISALSNGNFLVQIFPREGKTLKFEVTPRHTIVDSNAAAEKELKAQEWKSQDTTVTTDPEDPALKKVDENGMNEKYLVLPAEELEKGFVRPFRDMYVHKTCGVATRIGPKIAETYARDPSFYGMTYCTKCQQHRAVQEFYWATDNEDVGS
jgi:hypothetical protein